MGEVVGHSADVKAQHELLSLVRLRRLDTAIVIDREGHESLIGESLDDIANMGNEAPPLLHDDDAGASPRGGKGQDSRHVLTADLDRHLLHGESLPHDYPRCGHEQRIPGVMPLAGPSNRGPAAGSAAAPIRPTVAPFRIRSARAAPPPQSGRGR